ncbi:YkgJ family cysteine cluster protein [Desulfogranum mediterraneum]|uniref:YkgJ family cysteine cluster protein n=1 Tax=Desulfogranum mediterraneum TaxID=160661 RepID=UPI0004113945|nr:YkgJ family cysteine cluster protein [Desulfogranum mediterraneum]
MSELPQEIDIPEGRTTLENNQFNFHCHPGVSCYLKCCHDVRLHLFPYDIIRLKNRLKLHSGEFMQRHTFLGEGSHPFFPGVLLKLGTAEGLPCPFLSDQGCTVYPDRPSACRTYPLERGVSSTGKGGAMKEYYFLTHHPYCKGHLEERSYTLKQWQRDQALHEYNLHNDLWAEVDAFFATNPWQGEGKAGPLQQLAFMVCYNIDDFRAYTEAHGLLKRFGVDKAGRNRIKRDDGALLQFGFQWLRQHLGGPSALRRR